ncbi:MAG: class I SAM-dependent methyltransferase [Nanoarchaeota archaeon]
MNYYDTISEGYDELHREEQEKKISLIKEYFPIEKSDKLLDLGSGPGFAEFDCDVYRIDPSKKLLEKADGKKTLAFAENLPYPDNTFDKVISITAMQNFHDIKTAVAEMKRVCKGKFALSFLKKSSKKEYIEEILNEEFAVEKNINEEKDIIIIANYK